MVSSFQSFGDVTLFLASESLVLQLMRSCGPFRAPVLRVVRSRHPEVVGDALDSAPLSIIDATQDPQEALSLLEEGVRRVGPARIGVYTEIMHEGLEIPVRSLGVALWFGPCPATAWESILDGIEDGVVVSCGERLGSEETFPLGMLSLRRRPGVQKGGAQW